MAGICLPVGLPAKAGVGGWWGGGGWGGGGVSIGFGIGMLSTAGWLETLRRVKKGSRNYTFCQILTKNGALGWRALKTPTSETPDSEVTWPRSSFTTSGPGPLGFDSGRAWLQAGAQRVVIVVIPSLNSLGIDSRNGSRYDIFLIIAEI